MTSVAWRKGRGLCGRALKPVLSAAAFSLTIVCCVCPSRAEAAFTGGRTQVGLSLGTGRVLNGDYNAPLADIYDFGVGLGAGHTLSAGVYFGATFDYFLEQDGIGSTAQLLLASGVLGYDFGLTDAFVLRPELGVGYGRIGRSYFNGQSKADSKLVWIPGLKAIFGFGGWFVSPELRICIFDTPDEQSGDSVEKGLHASGVIASFGGGLEF